MYTDNEGIAFLGSFNKKIYLAQFVTFYFMYLMGKLSFILFIYDYINHDS